MHPAEAKPSKGRDGSAPELDEVSSLPVHRSDVQVLRKTLQSVIAVVDSGTQSDASEEDVAHAASPAEGRVRAVEVGTIRRHVPGDATDFDPGWSAGFLGADGAP